MGVAQLDIPAAGQGRRNDLCALDAHPEAAPGGRRAHGHRGLAGGRAHERRSAVCGRRGGGQRAAYGAGRPVSLRRSHAGRTGANTCSIVSAAPRAPPGCLHRGGHSPSTSSRSSGHRGQCALRVGRKDWRRQAKAQAPPAGKLCASSRRSAGRASWGSSGRGRAHADGALSRERFGIPSHGRPPEPGHQASSPPVNPSHL